MLFAPKTVTLKNGIVATLRSPRPEEAAEMLGFENIYYFSRVFSVCTGVSPSRYQHSLAGQS